MEDLLQIVCPADTPYLCLPYGSCCSHVQFCSKTTRACESCFPFHLENDAMGLLQWCRETGQFLKNEPQCRSACYARFNSSLLTSKSGNTIVDTSDRQELFRQLFLVGVLLISFTILLAIGSILYRNCFSRLIIVRRLRRAQGNPTRDVTELSLVPSSPMASDESKRAGEAMVKLRKSLDHKLEPKSDLDIEKGPADNRSESETLFGCQDLCYDDNRPDHEGVDPPGMGISDPESGQSSRRQSVSSAEGHQTMLKIDGSLQ